ncbi:ATP-binding protein [Candidatus Nephthysia bennettiae]|uniref:ATP-binding protein n=1 Tax=Candidatus Nephthysia bennettiae TaxID=3127016 RepID=UPI00331307E1
MASPSLVCGLPRFCPDSYPSALGEAAIEAGYRTYFTSAVDMVQSLQSAHLEGLSALKLRTYVQPSLLVIDELGCAPRGADVPCRMRDPPPVVAATG